MTLQRARHLLKPPDLGAPGHELVRRIETADGGRRQEGWVFPDPGVRPGNFSIRVLACVQRGASPIGGETLKNRRGGLSPPPRFRFVHEAHDADDSFDERDSRPIQALNVLRSMGLAPPTEWSRDPFVSFGSTNARFSTVPDSGTQSRPPSAGRTVWAIRGRWSSFPRASRGRATTLRPPCELRRTDRLSR